MQRIRAAHEVKEERKKIEEEIARNGREKLSQARIVREAVGGSAVRCRLKSAQVARER